MKILIYLGYGLSLFLFYLFYSRVGEYTLLSQVPNLLFTVAFQILLVKKHIKLSKKQ